MAINEKMLRSIKAKKDIAEKHRDEVWGLITDSIKYTSPNESSTKDDSTITTIDGTKGVYDSTAILESNKLAKKLTNMMFPSGVQYMGLVANENESRLNKAIVKKYGEEVFNMIERSNFNKELLNYVQNWSTLGTGALRIIETEDINMPFRFKQLPLKNLSFVEDGFGRPSYVFYKNMSMTNDQIEQVWGKGFNTEEMDKEFEVLETVYFERTQGMDGIYHYIVSDFELKEIIKEEQLTYNPFIITRYKRFANGIFWGSGEAMNCMANIVNINSCRYSLRVASERSIKPAYLGYGDKKVLSTLKIRMGEISYMGMSGQSDIRLAPQGDANLEAMTVQKDELVIKQTFYADFMNSVADNSGVRTAYEWQLRNQEFLNVFSPNYSMFEEEGLVPIFKGAFEILKKIQYGIMEKSTIDKLDMKPFFKNRLTDNSNFEKIQNFNRYLQNVVQSFGVPVAIMSIEVAESIEILSMWYEVEPKMLKDRSKYEQLLERYIEGLIGSQMPEQPQQPQQPQMQ